MNRFTEENVLLGLMTACRRAMEPTSLSPPLVNAMTEGVVRCPSAFATTVGLPPSMTAMHELVVPRSAAGGPRQQTTSPELVASAE